MNVSALQVSGGVLTQLSNPAIDNFDKSMSLLPASALTNAGQILEKPAGTALPGFPDVFNKVQDRTGPQVQAVGQQSFSAPGASVLPGPGQFAPTDVLRSKFEYAGNSLSSLNTRVGLIGPGTAGESLSNRLDLLNSRFRVLGNELEKSAAQNDPMQLLRLQNDIYQIDEELELLSRVVDQTTGGIRSLLQTQI